MLTLTIRFNHIRAQHNGAVVEHRGAFSNSRMIVADFLAFQAVVNEILDMAAEKTHLHATEQIVWQFSRYADWFGRARKFGGRIVAS